MSYLIKREQKKRHCKKNNISAAILIAIALSAGIWCISACDGKKSETSFSQQDPKGFTFFDIGSHTRLTDSVKNILENKLGHSVTERWRNVDLEIHYNGFIKKYFPHLHELNQKLKQEVILKPEENAIKLTYRHTRKKDTPFEYAGLLFSAYTDKPLVFKMKLKNGKSSGVIDIIREKHGQPRVIEWDENIAYGKKGRSLCWTYKRDMLILSVTPDRYDQLEYHIVIYYVENIEKELHTKEDRKEKKKNEVVREAF